MTDPDEPTISDYLRALARGTTSPSPGSPSRNTTGGAGSSGTGGVSAGSLVPASEATPSPSDALRALARTSTSQDGLRAIVPRQITLDSATADAEGVARVLAMSDEDLDAARRVDAWRREQAEQNRPRRRDVRHLSPENHL